jgi:hypothetical protein
MYRLGSLSSFADPQGRVPIAIEVGDDWYLLCFDSWELDDRVVEFLTGRNPVSPLRPAFLASARFPLLLSIDGVTVRAYPLWVARDRGAKTFWHPKLQRRVGTEKGPMWVFESNARPPSECGSVTAEQTAADVADLATVWLRSAASPDDSSASQ